LNELFCDMMGLMALPREYTSQACSLARSLEVVGERWSLLIVRDAFFGIRRFNDFSSHLRIPRAVLTDRLDFLIGEDVLVRTPGPGRRLEYELTEKGLALWPVVRTLTVWGDSFYAPGGRRRLFTHQDCGGEPDPVGGCPRCGEHVPLSAIVMRPGPGLPKPAADADAITRALSEPRKLLQPLPS
jgi:DNA-binding HxlR family transcriptional regulator